MAKASKSDWVVAGGAPGELGYCTRCGEGLKINLPQRLEVITAAMKAFAKSHGDCPPGAYVERPVMTPEEWLISRDTGISSLMIYCAVTGTKRPRRDFDFDIPHDPDDFGRCYRLLKLFPAWRVQLAKVVTICPQWKPFVEHWDELASLYEQESPAGTAPRLYERIQELRDERQ